MAGIAAAVVSLRFGDSGPNPLAPFPLPQPMVGSIDVSPDDFAGADACAECHQRQYRMWQSSTHGRAGGQANTSTVIAPFNGRPIRFADAVVIPSVRDGEYQFTVRQNGREEIVFTVDGVIGGGHMVGGGTQGFVSEYPDGTVRFLPFDWIREEQLWFCNTISRAERGWTRITSDMRLADCGDWPPIRILGTHGGFSNCQECHGSQILTEYDNGAKRYQTHFTDYAVNCESCHGPGVEHIKRANDGDLGSVLDIGIKTFATVSADTSLAICFQCHAVKTVLSEGYLPGEVFEQHYAPKLEVMGESPLFPDGRVRTFAYQQNHEYSDCYLSGAMSCVDCHDPHSNDYRDIYGRLLEGRFSNGQCLDCHASKAEDLTAHTNHRLDSPGSQCVSCHMPYLQHPELGDDLRFARSDHTIPIPRPAFDDKLGVQNACTSCHVDRSVAMLEEQVREWYGEIKPHKDIIRGLLSVEAVTDRVQALGELLPVNANHSLAILDALGVFIERHLGPDMLTLESEVVERLKALAVYDNVDVRAVALAGLHLSRGAQADVRDFLVDQLTSLTPVADGLVRSRWAITLGYVGDVYRARGELGLAILAYRKAVEVKPDDATVLAQLADTYARLDQFDTAVEFFTRAIDADPNRPLTWVNLGVALEGRDQMADAAVAYRRALDVNPNHTFALFNLGNYHLRRQELPEAIEFYERAVASDPSLAQGHYLLAQALAQISRLEDALAAVARALEFDPSNANAQALEARLINTQR